MITPKKKFERQWQTILESADDVKEERMIQAYIQTTLEATAVGMAVRDIVGKGRGEVHNSGNWAQGLKSVSEGENLPDEAKDKDLTPEERRKLKRKSKFYLRNEDDDPAPKNSNDTYKTAMHVHVYIPETGSEVVLPTLPHKETEAMKEDAQARELPIDEYDRVLTLWEDAEQRARYSDDDISAILAEHFNDNQLQNWLRENCQGSLTQEKSE